MSLTGFMRFWGFRGQRDRRNRERSALSLIIIVFVLAGAARSDIPSSYRAKADKLTRALIQVYRLVERKAKQWLIRAEYNILEVGD